MDKKYQLVQIPQNNPRQYDWIFSAYESQGVSLADGFQKDSIQNSAGARKKDNWKNWCCSISVVNNEIGQFIVIEDSGTEGLTGDNLTMTEIKRRTDLLKKDESLPSNMRLARFSSMNNSGGNQMGGGLYGVGKVIYSVASETFEYYFDSLREDGLYIANINFCGNIYEQAFENESAKNFIKAETGLLSKQSIGTRIIIKNPKKELVDAINSEEIVKYIQQSWWRIIQRMDSSSAIKINGKRVETPELPLSEHSFELADTVDFSHGYRVKHMGLFVTQKEDEQWSGVYYYRKGMRIGSVDLKEIPPKLHNKIWGYIEVDKNWEDELASIEDNIHYGVQKTKKNTTAYAYLKNYINGQFRSLMVEWGYIKDKENEDKKLKEELQKIAEEVQDLFDLLKFDDLGKGPKRPDYDVRWQDVSYPVKDSLKATTGDILKFGFKIKNGYHSKRTFQYLLKVVNCTDGAAVSIIDEGKVQIESQKAQDFSYSFNVNNANAAKGQKNNIELHVFLNNSKEKIKYLPIYYDVAEPMGRREVLLTLNHCVFPRLGSLRVNPDEEIKEVTYKMDNRRNEKLKFKLNVSVHNAEDPTNPKIFDVASIDGSVDPFEDAEIVVGDIKLNKELMDKIMPQGILELRARVICAEDCSDYEKGQKITFFTQRIYYNCDEKTGKADSFEIKMVDAHDKFQRSYLDISSVRIIYINSVHPAYLAIKDDSERQHIYLKEQVLKQYTLIYLNERKFAMFGENFDELDSVMANDRIMDKIEEIYYKSLKS